MSTIPTPDGVIQPIAADPAEIRRALDILTTSDSIVELRIPKAHTFTNQEGKAVRQTVFGWFTDKSLLAQEIARWSGKAPAIYITMNPVQPGLEMFQRRSLNQSARAHNRRVDGNEQVPSTCDNHIQKRLWFFTDFDPQRKGIVSSTEEEKAQSWETAQAVFAFLKDLGFPDPLIGDSGNGWHGGWRVDLPNDDSTTKTIETCLKVLAERFDTDHTKVDTSIFNAARIWKCYGSLAAKGAHSEERPHRIAHLVSVPDTLPVVPLDLLEQLAALKKPEPPKAPRATRAKATSGQGMNALGKGDYTTLDVVEWFHAHGHYGKHLKGNMHAVRCPWVHEHSEVRDDTDSDVVVYEADAKRWPGFDCKHSHCVDRGIGDVMELWGDADQFCEKEFRSFTSAGADPESPEAIEAAQQIEERLQALAEQVRKEHSDQPLWREVTWLATLNKTDWGRLSSVIRDVLGDRNFKPRALNAAIKEQQESRRIAHSVTASDGRPVIQTTGEYRDVVQATVNALQLGNTPPTLFVRGGRIVRMFRDEKGVPQLEPVSLAFLRLRASHCARFVKKDADVSPPQDVLEGILAMRQWPFPTLLGITETPCVRRNLSILDEDGYDPSSGFFYAPSENLKLPKVAERPSAAELLEAVDIIQDVIWDFPFADEVSGASRANTLALMLTFLMRPYINGPTPLAIISAPQQGNGKSLLAKIVTRIATGRAAGTCSPPKRGEEWAKSITAWLKSGRMAILIDNVVEPLDSADLAVATSSEVFSYRHLTTNDAPDMVNHAVWMATGNNVVLEKDMPRRTYWINLHAKVEFPDERPAEVFKHPDLNAWVDENRGRILWALLTMIRAWVAAGRPEFHPPLSTYEHWSRVVGGIIQHAGFEGFLGNRAAIRRASDPEAPQWAAFLARLLELKGCQPFTSLEAVRIIKSEDVNLLPDPLHAASELVGEKATDGKGDGKNKRIGNLFRRQLNTVRSNRLYLAEGLGPTGRPTDDSGRKYYRVEAVTN